jgi:hypothetical protein
MSTYVSPFPFSIPVLFVQDYKRVYKSTQLKKQKRDLLTRWIVLAKDILALSLNLRRTIIVMPRASGEST